MTSFISFLLVSLLFLTSALAVPLHIRDVADPPVTTPNTTTIWTAGSTQLVVWDTSKLPPYNQITNKVGTIVLGFNDSKGENLMLDKPLAKGFNITQGSIKVVVPVVPTRSNYIIVLMGDSGNASPMFTILGDGPKPSLIGDSTTPAPMPSGPPPTTDGSTTPSATGETISGSESATITPGSGSSSGGGASTPSSSLPLTTVVTTSSAAIQATATRSNGATSLHRARATCFGAVLIIASLLL